MYKDLTAPPKVFPDPHQSGESSGIRRHLVAHRRSGHPDRHLPGADYTFKVKDVASNELSERERNRMNRWAQRLR